ncbi:hypothetical protein ACJMK2_038161 [Sinanodonta woodiana]|uniref:G-protein coupled receptors family 1 profile domain-containing protein n=1 Tax=Sinanodonta woodiana TaxID=1069815 RepID=A0ABD3WMN3_SINWO
MIPILSISNVYILRLGYIIIISFPISPPRFFRDTTSDPCILEKLEPGVFDGLDELKILGIIGCERLRTIDAGVLGKFEKLYTLHIFRGGLVSVPNLTSFHTVNKDFNGMMTDIRLYDNVVDTLESNAFSDLQAVTVELNDNQITEIQSCAFCNSKIATLRLNNNDIKSLGDSVFKNADITNLFINNNPELSVLADDIFTRIVEKDTDIKSLKTLDLSQTSITKLPTEGLSELKELFLQRTRSLKQFPSVLRFNRIVRAELHYPHHCCAFKNPEKQDPHEWKVYKQFQEAIDTDCATTVSPVSVSTPTRHGLEHFHFNINKLIRRAAFNFPDTFLEKNKMKNFQALLENETIGGIAVKKISQDGDFFGKAFNHWHHQEIENTSDVISVFCGKLPKAEYYMKVICTPEPDAFNPCEDVMGYEWLRVVVWVVVLTTVLGNLTVLVVLLTGRGKLSVPKFLMCNLAFADFLMGVYLLMLAAIDLHTLGEYFTYAVSWQNEGGCQAAGFLTVFSSELSIFTLTIITLERWYAISHAIDLNKRLRFRQSMGIMAAGYVFTVVLATLPLLGISGYGNVSICLPMKVDNAVDAGYVISLLLLNGFAFLAICACYISMFLRVKGSDTIARNNDTTIAKRMALLVMTNFVCWAPIAFFGLTASAGAPLIDITNSKILLVFFYPFNSCANPFLYAILTKQFRKDVFILLGKYGICTEKANLYRGTYYTTRSFSHSRTKDLALTHMYQANGNGNVSNYTGSSHSSKASLNSTPRMTPQSTPKIPSHQSLDRKLSIVPETSHSSDAENVQMNDYTRDDVDKCAEHGGSPRYIRSVSEYMVLYNKRDVESYTRAPKQQVSIDTSTSFSSGYTDVTVVSDISNNIDSPKAFERKHEYDKRDSFEAIHNKELQSLNATAEKQFPSSSYSKYTGNNNYPTDENFENEISDLLSTRDQNLSVLCDYECSYLCSNIATKERARLTRSPSLSSLDENVEQPLLYSDTYISPSPRSSINDDTRDTSCSGEQISCKDCTLP